MAKDFLQFLKQVLYPCWVERPADWVWIDMVGRPLGLKEMAGERPGLFNLAWLALDIPEPPTVYNARKNALLMIVLIQNDLVKVGDMSIELYAATHSLEEFSKLKGSDYTWVDDLAAIARRKLSEQKTAKR